MQCHHFMAFWCCCDISHMLCQVGKCVLGTMDPLDWSGHHGVCVCRLTCTHQPKLPKMLWIQCSYILCVQCTSALPFLLLESINPSFQCHHPHTSHYTTPSHHTTSHHITHTHTITPHHITHTSHTHTPSHHTTSHTHITHTHHHTTPHHTHPHPHHTTPSSSFPSFPQSKRLHTVTAIKVPEDIKDWKELITYAMKT